MTGFIYLTSECAACPTLINYNPNHVPSLRVKGERQAICPVCFARWNKIHRTDKGLEPLEIHPDAYKAEPVENVL